MTTSIVDTRDNARSATVLGHLGPEQALGLGRPLRNGPPVVTATPTTPQLDPAVLSLNRGLLPARERSAEELAAWVRREEEYATLGASVVVELNSESRTRRPTARAWAIIRRGQRVYHRAADRERRSQRRPADRTAIRTSRVRQQQERDTIADARWPQSTPNPQR